MDERIQDRIDRYLRKEMSQEENINFEQEALNNDELRKELGLSLLVRKSLASRQQKLNLTNRWKHRGKAKLMSFVLITSIAALLVIGVVVLKPTNSSTLNKEMVAQNKASETLATIEKQEKVAETMKNVRNKTNDKEIVETIEELEKQNDIPTISDVSDAQYMSSKQQKDSNEDINLNIKVYELYWMKIRSLLRMGRKEEALTLLKQFVLLEGSHKAQADSILKEFEK